ncbi:hypothetical protein ABW636_04900 [Aquimarina sp. 2201CG1-2-11]|uniref:hypothetical protein n=1 Tax=Aquimarina discodermiae TaxID=3231043 RepID=UPI003461B3D0
MSSNTTKVVNSLLNAPLPQIVERLGFAIANAQAELDKNSAALIETLVDTTVNLDGEDYSLIALGFTPTFYAFTEAVIEAKMDFSIKEETKFEGEVTAGVNLAIFSASVTATYARKFGIEASGSSAITTKLVSLPPPDALNKIVNGIITKKYNASGKVKPSKDLK